MVTGVQTCALPISHAAAGDDAAAASGEIGMLASDLLPFIRARLNHLVEHAAP